MYDQTLNKVKIIVDGTEIEKDVYRSRIQGDTLWKYVKIDETTQGLITKAALVDSMEREWYVKDLNYQKGQKGFVIAFPIRLRIGVGE